MAGDGPAAIDPGRAGGTIPTDDAWCGLAWTAWAPLERAAVRRMAPSLSGVYRVRRAGGDPGRLVYVGQTTRGLRERLLALAAGANAAECPFNDPHTAAPHLWLLRGLGGARLEVSCAPVESGVPVLRGTEDMLLWRHRVETGLSTEANHGRFYPGYARPTNRWVVRGGRSGARSPGRRAGPLAADAAAVDFGLSHHPVLGGEAGPLQAPWWLRAPLAGAARSAPAGPAVYCVHGLDADEPVYVGETLSLPARVAVHAAAPWPVPEPWLAYLPLPGGTPKHVLRELESDLLGWHFWRTGRAPASQYSAPPRATPVIGAEAGA